MDNNEFISVNNKRLKKVKRPIKRSQPQNPNAPFPQQSNLPSQPSRNAFDLENNLPTTSFQNDFVQPSANEVPHFIDENDLAAENSVNTEQNFVPKKTLIIAVVLALFVGAFFTKIFFGQQKIVRDGLQGVVVNSEVPRGRARCGVAEKTQGCVLYIMNPQRQDLVASDFYDLASQLTGRQRFIIETGNMRYSSQKIKPGEIAQFNIPPLQ